DLRDIYVDVYHLFFFFFQAEDGIRDGHVTGVQTCALPISFSGARASCVRHDLLTQLRRISARKMQHTPERCPKAAVDATRTSSRSEERRVGKECRSRRAQHH